MTDHRVNDLSYGHLGESSYDVDTQSWLFSRDTTLDSSIQSLQPLRECIPPSLRVLPDWVKKDPGLRSSQIKWLQKKFPETGPAKATIISMTKEENFVSLPPSTLFALGKASDIDQTTGTRSIEIMAIVHGKVGNLLRLIKPRVEVLKWNSQHDIKLRTIDPDTDEDCYWLGDGGAIQQITFGIDLHGNTSWLAVLKPESVTILRPVYRRYHTPSSLPDSVEQIFPPSRLSPNQLLRLGNERTGPSPNADVSFNPWYIRQFATVNQNGYWAIWNIEGQKQKRTTFRLEPGKSGYIWSDSPSGQSINSHDNIDGWSRIMWAGSFKTILVCGRRNFTVFDLKAAPKRLHSPNIIHAKSPDWILDIKRSPINLSHVFLLTTRQIFWLQIVDAGEETEQSDKSGAKVLLSYQHFRNLANGNARLDLIGENEACTVLIYVPQSPLVNTYRFSTVSSTASARSMRPVCTQGSFTIKFKTEENVDKPFNLFQTLCLVPTSFIPQNQTLLSGLAKDCMDHKIRFYQLFGLSETLGLYQTLCATNCITPGEGNTESIRFRTVLPPTIKDRRIGRVKTSYRFFEHHFIVPDGLDEEDDTASKSYDNRAHSVSLTLNGRPKRIVDEHYLSIDARSLFEVSFLGGGFRQPENSTLSVEPQNMARYLEMILSYIEQRKEQGIPGLITFFEMIGNTTFLEDIDEAAPTFTNFLKVLRSNNEATSTMISDPFFIKPSPFLYLEPATELKAAIPDLSDVYDKLVNMWVSCLPRKTPGPVRLAKEKLVRVVATELYLSATGVAIRNRNVDHPQKAASQAEVGLVLPVRNKPNSFENVDRLYSQVSPTLPMLNLPTPAATLSMPSSDSKVSFQDPTEDEAISRLRCYALSIKTQPPLGTSRSAILTHWPSAPGADPSKYSWEMSRQAIAEEHILEGDQKEGLDRRREQARQRRRTEGFLKRQRVNTIDAESQPLPILKLGSQQDPAQHPVSSEGMNLPMTQPDRGNFGSRRGLKTFKKRRTMGF